MINIEIDGKKIENIIYHNDRVIVGLSERIKSLENELIKTTGKLDKQIDDFTALQNKIIEIQENGSKERISLWNFLTGWTSKKETKPSRIIESTVVLTK